MYLEKEKFSIVIILCVITIIVFSFSFTTFHTRNDLPIGYKMDSLHGIVVYYNGPVTHVLGRNTTEDGYNLGLQYQCVEFVKRYYYYRFGHKMPNSYGHAKDFFDFDVSDGNFNSKRGLIQFNQHGSFKPQIGDILVFGPYKANRFGHVAIVSNVHESKIEIIQQNAGGVNRSREKLSLTYERESWYVHGENVLGWLRMR